MTAAIAHERDTRPIGSLSIRSLSLHPHARPGSFFSAARQCDSTSGCRGAPPRSRSAAWPDCHGRCPPPMLSIPPVGRYSFHGPRRSGASLQLGTALRRLLSRRGSPSSLCPAATRRQAQTTRPRDRGTPLECRFIDGRRMKDRTFTRPWSMGNSIRYATTGASLFLGRSLAPTVWMVLDPRSQVFELRTESYSLSTRLLPTTAAAVFCPMGRLGHLGWLRTFDALRA